MFSNVQLFTLVVAVVTMVVLVAGLTWLRHVDEDLSMGRRVWLLARSLMLTLGVLAVLVGAIYGVESGLSSLPPFIGIFETEVSTVKVYGMGMLLLSVFILVGGFTWLKHLDEGLPVRLRLLMRSLMLTLGVLAVLVGAIYSVESWLSSLPPLIGILGSEVSTMKVIGGMLAVFNVVLFVCGLVWFRHLDEGLSAGRWAWLLVRTALITLGGLAVLIGAIYGLVSLLSSLSPQMNVMGTGLSAVQVEVLLVATLTVVSFVGGLFWLYFGGGR